MRCLGQRSTRPRRTDRYAKGEKKGQVLLDIGTAILILWEYQDKHSTYLGPLRLNGVFRTVADRDAHAQGWEMCINGLARELGEGDSPS